jgi:hypothetical protein
MPSKWVCVALVAIFALAASQSAQAQVMVDVTKVNCDQFVHHKISEPKLIAAWLSGLACTRFRRHRVRCFDGTGGGSWRDGSLRGSSSLRPCG